jgi:hypothetical protein
MNLRTLLALATLIVSAFSSEVFAASGRDIAPQSQITTCTGKEAVCSPVMNAVGDVVEINPASVKFTTLGKITAAKPVTVKLPQTPGQRVGYKFTPTTGSAAGRNINVVLENVKQAAGTRRAGLSVINVYTQHEGQAANKWTTAAELTEIPAQQASVSLKADGTVTVSDPRTKRPVTINLTEQAHAGRTGAAAAA